MKILIASLALATILAGCSSEIKVDGLAMLKAEEFCVNNGGTKYIAFHNRKAGVACKNGAFFGEVLYLPLGLDVWVLSSKYKQQ